MPEENPPPDIDVIHPELESIELRSRSRKNHTVVRSGQHVQAKKYLSFWLKIFKVPRFFVETGEIYEGLFRAIQGEQF